MITIDLDSSTSTTSMSRKKFVRENKIAIMETVDLDKALILTEYGRFHYEIIASSAFCLLTSGLQNGLAAYVLPAAHCELNLSSSQIGFVNASFLIGATCSSFLWGVLADLKGRKNVLVVTLLLDAVVTFCCSLMQDFFGLVVCRFLNGFLIGAPGSLTFTYMAEFHAPHHRSKIIYYSGIFYTLSWLLLPIIARIVLSFQIEIEFGGLIICSSWRIFLILIILPELVAGFWILRLPESPKFLVNKDPKKALIVLKEMYARNTGNDRDQFPVKNLINEAKILNCTANSNVNCRGKVARLIQDICTQIKHLFESPLLMFTIILSGIMFSNMFGYFGLGLWLPEFLTHTEETELTKNITTNNMTLLNESCLPEFDSVLFISTVLMGTSCLIGNFLSGWFAGQFDRYVIPLVTMLAGGISAGSFYWLNSSLQNLIAACIFQSAMSTANIVIGGVVVELFPTSVNGMAICTTMFSGRIAAILSNIIFGFLIDKYCQIAIFIVAAVLLFGAVLCMMIPNRIDKTGYNNKKSNIEVSVVSMNSL